MTAFASTWLWQRQPGARASHRSNGPAQPLRHATVELLCIDVDVSAQALDVERVQVMSACIDVEVERVQVIDRMNLPSPCGTPQ